MVDVRKKLSNVAFQHEAGSCMVATCFVRECAEAVHGAVCSLPKTTGIRIGDKGAVEERIEFPVKSVMQKPVPNAPVLADTGFGSPDAIHRDRFAYYQL